MWIQPPCNKTHFTNIKNCMTSSGTKGSLVLSSGSPPPPLPSMSRIRSISTTGTLCTQCDPSPPPLRHFATGLTSEYFLSKWMSVSCRKVMVLELPSRFIPLLLFCVCWRWLLVAPYCLISASLWLLDGRYSLFSNFLFLSFSRIKDSRCLSICRSKGEPLSSWRSNEAWLQRWSASHTSRGSNTFSARTYWTCG